MDESSRRALEALQDIPDKASDSEGAGLGIDDILDGSTPIDFSHTGGEFNQILENDLRTERRCVFGLFGPFIRSK
jgi:hypothetical protein